MPQILPIRIGVVELFVRVHSLEDLLDEGEFEGADAVHDGHALGQVVGEQQVDQGFHVALEDQAEQARVRQQVQVVLAVYVVSVVSVEAKDATLVIKY